MMTEKQVLAELKRVVDPELGFNIVDLGLVYGVEIKDKEVMVKMTLTSPACPLGGMIRAQVKERLKTNLGIKKVKVKFTFDPPWNPQRMTASLRASLGW